MGGFKNDVSDGWLFRQELSMFKNFISNWDRDVEDRDFFDIFGNPNNSSQQEAKSMFAKFQKSWRIGDDFFRNMELNIAEFWNRDATSRKSCREMLEEWCGNMEKRKSYDCRRKDPLEERVDEVCRVLTLNETERSVLIYAMVRKMTCFDDFPALCTKGRNDRALFIAMAVDRPCSTVTDALSPDSKLIRFTVLDDDGDLIPNGPFGKYLDGGGSGLLEGEFYRKLDTDDALPWEYYGKLAEDHGEILKKMIGSANHGTRGLNILFYGEPGTGKTSFAKTLSRELKLDLFEIRQCDKDGENGTSDSRMAGIRICNEQVPREGSLVVVDESDQLLRTNAEMLFGFRASHGSEKGQVNSILDETKIPTIWIANTSARSIDPSVRRRFDYSIKFEKLTAAQRKLIWRNSVGKFGLKRMIPERTYGQFAQKYATNASGIAMVLENVKRMHPKKEKAAEMIERLMKPHCELMGWEPNSAGWEPAKDYSLEGLNIKGELKLERIVEAVRNFRDHKDEDAGIDRPRMNLLLWGPPGTGKTEFVKYLGKELNCKVNVKMGSDLLSRYVGGTEELIRTAFEESEEENSILFLDEIDGMVQDRSGAQRSWEVSQVNELLQRMENFKGVMVGATNFMDNLDSAIMRRFTFKLQFNYLDTAGKRKFFERTFDTRLDRDEERRLAEIPNLAPGDFRTVRQSMYYLGGEITNAQRLAELEKESKIKRATRNAGRKIGFMPET